MAHLMEEKVLSFPPIVEHILKTSSGFEPLWCYLLLISAVSGRVQIAGALLSIGY